jgi:hypothetical protein
MRRKREKVKTSIGIAVSFGGLSKPEYKIVTLRCDSSTATVTSLGRLSRDGTKFTLNPIWTEMSELNGLLATEAKTEIGNKMKRNKNETVH